MPGMPSERRLAGARCAWGGVVLRFGAGSFAFSWRFLKVSGDESWPGPIGGAFGPDYVRFHQISFSEVEYFGRLIGPGVSWAHGSQLFLLEDAWQCEKDRV